MSELDRLPRRDVPAMAWLLSAALLSPAAALAQAPLTPPLEAALARSAGGTQPVWVFFTDKGPRPETRLAEARALLTPRALSRRALRGSDAAVGLRDLPLPEAYVQEVEKRVVRLRNRSRWFGAVSVEADAEQVRALQQLPFVARLDLVRGYRRGVEEKALRLAPLARGLDDLDRQGTIRLTAGFDYGPSLGQVAQIKVPEVHDMGLHGEGVVVGVFDAGFNNLAHEAFAGLRILARHDFVNGDEDVGDGADRGEGSHGTETLSTLAGFQPGQLIGPAFAASFLLAKTENTDSETPVEEDNWAAAAEWAEALGVDVVSSSLGYLDFDSPYPSYTWADMNGDRAISTLAAERAASLGVVVVNSAGNSGFDPDHNTLGAPADGRHVLAVAAVSSSGTRAAFSSVGPSADGRVKPDVAAQGVAVRVASPYQVNGYTVSNGTSFSCPLTAGVAALVVQAHPTATVDQVLATLRGTASQAGAPDRLLGYGLVDALAAVNAPQP
jgi:hypothetical protein